LELHSVSPFDGEVPRYRESSIWPDSSRELGLSASVHSFRSTAIQAAAAHLGTAAAAASDGTRQHPWVDKLGRPISASGRLKTAGSRRLSPQGKEGHIYRAIMNRHKLYKNGKRAFLRLLVETIRPPDLSASAKNLHVLTALPWLALAIHPSSSDGARQWTQFDATAPTRSSRVHASMLEYNREWMEKGGQSSRSRRPGRDEDALVSISEPA